MNNKLIHIALYLNERTIFFDLNLLVYVLLAYNNISLSSIKL